ncbi:MAG: 3-methyl-2-oxobutanoate hydroxymethyltransferase [Candidatus Omnitrophica bacterium]|nr:3-methyl-2-oxobutanoate hydroxymethyltransferase [Candidatus Omnitrophota bacterium]HOX55073.1 3-methyl-2-oxobutanoate hydroxymethyltransferase [Candidatus Omnitrophota bacterium]
MERNKITLEDIKRLKQKKQKITMLTAYDFPTASLMDQAGIDMVLVGDSVANVVLGLKSTTQVGMAEMIHHTKAVKRAIKYAFLVGDMPFESYQVNPEESVKNAKRFMDEGCDAVKLEWFDKCPQVTEKIIKAGIPVMGHIGLTPQTADQLGGFKVQGKDAEAAKRLIQQAELLEKLGCFSIVLECVPDLVAKQITEKLRIPTVGIGAGIYCDGQVLVTHDLLGLFERFKPKFVKQYINLSPKILEAFKQYIEEVVSGKFPTPEHSFTIKKEELDKI